MRVAVVLSGCGFLDGSEIHESVLALAALDRAGAQVTIAAPVVELEALDHRTRAPHGQRRSVLAEAARIARGKIVELYRLDPAEFDALVLPGGYGAARTLCDFESKGAAAQVLPALARLVVALHAAHKPIGAICIAPAIVAAVLRDAKVSARLTFGNDPGLARLLREMGHEAVDCATDQCVVDAKERIVCTPAYMDEAARISDVAQGIERLVEELVKLSRAATTTPSASR